MSGTTPEYDDCNDESDVGLGLYDAAPAPTSLTCRSVTHPITGVVVYPHGFSVRMWFNIEMAAVAAALPRCGWSEAPSRAWKYSVSKSGVERWVLRGSKWLNERPPQNSRLPLAGRNLSWKTRLYSLAIERKEGIFAVDLQGVRYTDITKFIVEVLGLSETDYTIEYYRRAERFIVLWPHEAFRLAAELDAQPVAGRARWSRKRYLVKDYPIPVTVRCWAKTVATLNVYRIEGGATSQFKVEVALRGQRNDRGQFGETDIETLDRILLDLITDHDLHPIAKPARWEPRSFNTAVERGDFDPFMQRLPHRAYRGSKLKPSTIRLVRRCHTPSLVRLVECAADSGMNPSDHRIRANTSTPSPSGSSDAQPLVWQCVEGSGFGIRRYLNTAQVDAPTPSTVTSTPWKAAAKEVALLPGNFFEFVFDPEHDPADLVKAIIEEGIGPVAVSALCAASDNGHADTWQSILNMMPEHPANDDAAVWVLVIDPSAFVDVSTAVTVCDDDTTTLRDGPLVNPTWAEKVGVVEPLQVRAMAAWLWETFAGIKDICEKTGLRVVVITADARPDHGKAGLLPSHYFRDPRVRSFVGDAARYHCHQRYLVERDTYTVSFPARMTRTEHEVDGAPVFLEEHARVEHRRFVWQIVCMKDLAEGQQGRVIYGGRRPRVGASRRSNSTRGAAIEP